MRLQSWGDCVGAGAVVVVGEEVEAQVCFAEGGHQGNPSIFHFACLFSFSMY